MPGFPVSTQAPVGAGGWQKSQGRGREGKADRTYSGEVGDGRCGTSFELRLQSPQLKLHALQTSLTKHKFKYKIKNFQMAITDD